MDVVDGWVVSGALFALLYILHVREREVLFMIVLELMALELRLWTQL